MPKLKGVAGQSSIIIISMAKHHTHKIWRRFTRISFWYFLAATLVLGIITIFALRQNNQTMVSLRTAVYVADEQNSGTQEALAKLQAYVTSHMNTSLTTGNTSVYPPIQLKYTYSRLVVAQSSATAASNQQIYTDAQHYCEAQNSTDISGRNRVPCIEAYVSEHLPKQSVAIPDALYKFDFVSPKWSPDFAGWMVVLLFISAGLTIVSLAARLFNRSTRN